MEIIVQVFRSWFSLLVGTLLVFFRRARLTCGGQVVEDIDDFNRLSLMLTDLLPEDDQHDISCEGFGHFHFVKGEAAQAADQRKSFRQTEYDLSGNVDLARRVMFKPVRGRFNQDKSLPLRYWPIQIEPELVNSQADARSLEVAEGFSNGANCDISDIQCKYDLLTLGNSLDNGHASHLLSGKSLPINFNTCTNQSTGNDKSFSAHVTRAVIRLKSIFITLHKPDGVAYKQANDFYHPAGTNGLMTLSNKHSIQGQIFSKPIRISCQFGVRRLQPT